MLALTSTKRESLSGRSRPSTSPSKRLSASTSHLAPPSSPQKPRPSTAAANEKPLRPARGVAGSQFDIRPSKTSPLRPAASGKISLFRHKGKPQAQYRGNQILIFFKFRFFFFFQKPIQTCNLTKLHFPQTSHI